MALIRDAQGEDQSDLRHLTWLLWNHHHQRRPDRFRPADEVAHANGAPPPSQAEARTLIADLDGRVAGYIKAVLREMPETLAQRPQRVVVVTEIAVLQDARRLGIGRELLAAIQDWARDAMATALEVPVFGFNREALALYDEMGFTPWFLQLRCELR